MSGSIAGMKVGVVVTVLLFVVAAVGVGLAGAQIPKFGDLVVEDTRTPVPGSRVVELEGRRYNIFYEARGPVDSYDNLPVPALEISVERADGDGGPLPLRDYSGSLSTSGGGRRSEAIQTVRVPRTGRYRIEVHGRPPRAGLTEPTVALGEPIGRKVLLLVVGIVVALLCGLSGILVLIFTVIQRSKR
jgi:hypothetical protein